MIHEYLKSIYYYDKEHICYLHCNTGLQGFHKNYKHYKGIKSNPIKQMKQQLIPRILANNSNWKKKTSVKKLRKKLNFSYYTNRHHDVTYLKWWQQIYNYKLFSPKSQCSALTQSFPIFCNKSCYILESMKINEDTDTKRGQSIDFLTFNVYYPLKGHTYSNKSAHESCSFV